MRVFRGPRESPSPYLRILAAPGRGLRRGLLLSLIFLILVIALLRFAASYTLLDDGYIFMRYAVNVASGDGFVWNPGGPLVEGYTSFLYLILLSTLTAVGLSPVAGSLVISLLFGALCVPVIWVLAERTNRGAKVENLMAVGLAVLAPNFTFWLTAGMETPLYTFTVLAGAAAYFHFRMTGRNAALVGTAYAFCAMARPEGVLQFAFVILFEAVHRWRGAGPILDREFYKLIAPFGVLYGGYFLWRWQYFDALLPNTYYAKSGGSLYQIRGGLNYLQRSWIYIFAGSAVVLIPLLLLAPLRSGQRKWPIAFLAFNTLAVSISTILVGGDHFATARFLVPATPFVMILVSSGLYFALSRVGRESLRPVAAAGLLVVALASWVRTDGYHGLAEALLDLPARPSRPTLPAANQSRMVYYDNWVRGFVLMGQTLRQELEPEESVAVVPIGAIGYYSERTVHDMLGIVDEHIAHQPAEVEYVESWRPGHDKGDGAYILSLKPDYIQLLDRLTSQPHPGPSDYMMQFKSIVEIWSSEQFHEIYWHQAIEVQSGWYYNLYTRAEVSE